MEIFLIIIGVLSIVQFLIKFTALCFIELLNKKERENKKIEELNPIYYLSCDKSLYTKAELGEVFFIPSISAYTNSKELVITVKWLNFTYTIVYYYKHSSDC